jgi:hypothetical protein
MAERPFSRITLSSLACSDAGGPQAVIPRIFPSTFLACSSINPMSLPRSRSSMSARHVCAMRTINRSNPSWPCIRPTDPQKQVLDPCRQPEESYIGQPWIQRSGVVEAVYWPPQSSQSMQHEWLYAPVASWPLLSNNLRKHRCGAPKSIVN